MSEEDERIRGLMGGYASLYPRIDYDLYEVFKAKDMKEFWRRLEFFINVMPVPIKKETVEEYRETNRRFHKRLRNVRGTDKADTTRRRVFEEEAFITHRAMELHGKIEDLLYARGYKEIVSHRIKLADFDELEKSESEDQVGQG